MSSLTMTFHGLNRILERGFELNVVPTLQYVGEELNKATEIALPLLNDKPLSFKYRGTTFRGTKGRLRTNVEINDRIYVVGLNENLTPTIITTWRKP